MSLLVSTFGSTCLCFDRTLMNPSRASCRQTLEAASVTSFTALSVDWVWLENIGGLNGFVRNPLISFFDKKVWQFDSVVRTTCYISAIIGLWKELSKMKVFKKQLIMCIKRLRQFCGIKKNPEKTRVVRTTHGRWRTLKFLCPPTTMRCTYNKPFSSKLLTLQGNGKHKQCFICHALSYSSQIGDKKYVQSRKG